MLTDGQTKRHDEANSNFLQFVAKSPQKRTVFNKLFTRTV